MRSDKFSVPVSWLVVRRALARQLARCRPGEHCKAYASVRLELKRAVRRELDELRGQP